MEEEMLSLISNGGTNASHVNAEASDSNSSSCQCHATKRHRQGNNDASPRFKGVVAQHNGHWGAQIYANHQRVWLGTFKSEKEAAMAYDSAAIKLRSGDSHRNIPWANPNLALHEPMFQNQYSTEAVLNMIKDGSYLSKFTDFLKTSSLGQTEVGLNSLRAHHSDGRLRRQLFQKELTPSDVGKLNRLVIPKKYAVKHFPPISETADENAEGSGADDIQLIFFDRFMRSWIFRYCYWRSSQSFVFTRGWNRFVKEMGLKAKDIITFYLCQHPEGPKEGQTFCMIDVGYNGGQNNVGVVDQYAGMLVDSPSHLEQRIGHVNDEPNLEEGMESAGLKLADNASRRGFKLFGVHI
ncbi:AP2/ERF and B3 domain-containing transcription factor At1g50680-like [Malania oleifera]|uniref:AP2/ERF and B3 domain-containing transcription factor At1g50680-like n=1 Tax=Malania oleifera TaxID=397392 RepID=UPI0025ADB6AA|nr:AP2/ERF and B3 domain-containing transcription factor At1g50680-like [Malania oleifera]XP_057967507.1 AP2/ERF and B3 domain-containing transcription factor At1g50680-like [Malania oleifera]XP_057967508.1 AP2/ERF and B3 domain-containing transcription factor At1g50680-like [Malania oleifera]XP_057967509.1 AP2/ERF and B3 domain-containing transcription factor At1g50680-like [Malania oleifera]XP_057967512.1 AP2/ERF and B3 domain-containing transcription factor At1g50680-like [Malania oleifera]